jgi:hypothetical protein
MPFHKLVRNRKGRNNMTAGATPGNKYAQLRQCFFLM